MEGKNAIDAERRAMRTKTVVAGDNVTSLCDELRQLREQMAAMTIMILRTLVLAGACGRVPSLPWACTQGGGRLGPLRRARCECVRATRRWPAKA
eukprot:3957170-Pleurochrysis_carterae.AAC.1